MGRLVIIGLLTTVLYGCPERIVVRTEVQEVKVPILYCPAPPKLVRPELPIHNMTPEQKNSAGEVAKHYKATIKMLLGYSKELEMELDKYNKINDKYKNTELDVNEKYNFNNEDK